jgi:hypothetical protein
MYRVRWRRLLLVVGIFGLLPLVVALFTGVDILPLLIAWGLIFLVGAGGAGLRMYGEAYYRPAEDWDQRRDTDAQFERPRDEGRLL